MCRILSKAWNFCHQIFQALENFPRDFLWRAPRHPMPGKPALPVSNLWSSSARPEILKIMLTKSCAGSMLPYDFVLMILLFFCSRTRQSAAPATTTSVA
jgi:hypothetical protein